MFPTVLLLTPLAMMHVEIRYQSGEWHLGVSVHQTDHVLCSPLACTHLLPGFAMNFRCKSQHII